MRNQVVSTPVQVGARIGTRMRRLVPASAAAAAVAAAAVAVALLTLGGPGGGTGVDDAAAAVKKAATVTAEAADRSGTAVVRVTRNGEVWGGTTTAGTTEASRSHAMFPRPNRSSRIPP